jgi:transposase
MALLGVRRRLVDMRVEIDGQIRGILKTFGLVVGSGNKGALPNAHGQLTGLGRSIVLGRQKSTGLLPQRTHCYVRRPADLISPRRT